MDSWVLPFVLHGLFAGLGDDGVEALCMTIIIEHHWQCYQQRLRLSSASSSTTMDQHIPFTLKRLDLCYNGIGAAGAESLSDCLVALPMLEELDLNFNEGIGDEGVEYLAGALRAGAGKGLRELMLTNVGMGEQGARALIEVLDDDTCCPQLTELVLLDNGLGGDELRVDLRNLGASRNPFLTICVEGLGFFNLENLWASGRHFSGRLERWC